MVFKKNISYSNPSLLKRVVELKELEKKNYEDSAEILKKEFNLKGFSKESYKKLYNRAIAKKITIDRKTGNKFEKYSIDLEKMYGKVIKTLNRLVEALDSIYNEFETSDMDKMQKYLKFIKLSPQIKMTTEQILLLIRHQEEQQDKIRIEQKSFIWSTDQFKEKIDGYLRLLQKEGYIKVLKQF